MLAQNDEQLLWKYIDGFTTIEEKTYLLECLKTDQQLSQRLRSLQMMDDILLEQETVRLSETLRIKILRSAENIGRSKAFVTSGFYKKGMISFAAFNIAMLVFGILIYVYSSGLFTTSPELSMFRAFYQIIEKPLIRSFFMVCIALLSLLFLDQLFKNRSYGKTTTPV